MVKIGIIGGSGLDDPKILDNPEDIEVNTVYGKPSSKLICGKISEVDIVLLARHGKKHTIPPTQVNYRANIYALKEQGCSHILATTACGSLREEIGRGDFVILDQFIDFTRHRKITFHEEFEVGNAKHTPMAEPFSEELRNILNEGCEELGLKHHKKGTVITIEGPRFSTKAESHMFRSWGADVINMSIAPEVILANELGIPYAAIAMSTDYDCWKSEEESVTWERILKVFKENVSKVTKLLITTIPKIKENNFDVEDIKNKIRTIPDWPKKGIMFRDITTLLKDSESMNKVINQFYDRYKDKKIDAIAAVESRGFILGGALAHKLGVAFIPLRKPGKLPAETIGYNYVKEYGPDRIEMHKDAISSGQNVLLIDDLVATGDTALAAIKLIERLGGKVLECGFMIELSDLRGREKLNGYDVFSLVSFEGE